MCSSEKFHNIHQKIGDFATITDFDSSQDRIELKGVLKDYRLQVVGNNTRILLYDENNPYRPDPPEIIGIVQGRTNLRLDSDDFLFYERENPGGVTNNSVFSGDNAESLSYLSSGSEVNISAQLTTVQPNNNTDVDFFSFSLETAGNVTIRTVTSGDTVLGLFDNNGTLLQFDDQSGGGNSSLITSLLDLGSYSISVSKFPSFPEDGGNFSGDASYLPDFSYTLEVSVA
ncbi:MAG: DVUA0089 family protein [Nostoc sp.]|uniref:DVUA0089 family protein n=1 Tax=Nostoc sp. TaxID=1180 RepID=UPI002FFAC09A